MKPHSLSQTATGHRSTHAEERTVRPLLHTEAQRWLQLASEAVIDRGERMPRPPSQRTWTALSLFPILCFDVGTNKAVYLKRKITITCMYCKYS